MTAHHSMLWGKLVIFSRVVGCTALCLGHVCTSMLLLQGWAALSWCFSIPESARSHGSLDLHGLLYEAQSVTLFPSGRSRVRQMAKAILLLEKLRWRQKNGRRKYKCVQWGRPGRTVISGLQRLKSRKKKSVSCFLVKVPYWFQKISAANCLSLFVLSKPSDPVVIFSPSLFLSSLQS